MPNLTAKQQQVFDYIVSRLDDGLPPTVREICSQTGIKSTSTVFGILNALEFSGADLEECDATAVVGVHVGMDLKAETREFLFERIHRSFQRAYRSRGGGNLNEAFEELLYAKGVECPKCWEEHGFGTLGPGIGQRYDRDQDGRFFETEGWHELFDVQ